MNSQYESIIIGSDHAGFDLKAHIRQELDKRNIPYEDIGVASPDPTDYPLWAGRVARAVADGERRRGITICGTGIGASIAANRFRGVRAALCVTADMARISRQHNNANVLVLGGRITPAETATQILEAWLNTPFEGGRHERRTAQLDDIDNALGQARK